jgi:hypothetical protein
MQHMITNFFASPGGFEKRVHPLILLSSLPLVDRYLGKLSPMNNRITLRLAIHNREHITPELIELTNVRRM